jgi:hypothetical protein
MSRRQDRKRVLCDLERDLADADPCLDELFLAFSQLAGGGKMPRAEKIRTGPLGLITRLGGRMRPASDDFDRPTAWWL